MYRQLLPYNSRSNSINGDLTSLASSLLFTIFPYTVYLIQVDFSLTCSLRALFSKTHLSGNLLHAQLVCHPTHREILHVHTHSPFFAFFYTIHVRTHCHTPGVFFQRPLILSHIVKILLTKQFITREAEEIFN